MPIDRRRERAGRAAVALAAALGLAGCAGGGGGDGAASSAPSPAASSGGGASAPAASAALGRADGRGVIRFEDYAVIQARSGDTVETMAARVGLAPSELAAYNGLPVGYAPQPGDELVLPPRAEGYAGGAAVAAAPQTAPAPAAATEARPLSAPSAPPPSATSSAAPGAVESAAGGWSAARIGAALDGGATPAAAPAPLADTGGPSREVLYHDVRDGETVYSVARLYGVAPETLIAWNALSGPDYRVSPGQVLTIPAGGGGGPLAPAPTAPGRGAPATPPRSAAAPLPPDTEAPRPLASPELSQYQTETAPAASPPPAPAASAPLSAPSEAEPETETETAAASPAATPEAAEPGRLLRPVPGRIVRPYSRERSGGRDDGVDFAAAPGDPVRAAADGEVALVSTSLGEWGTIVLLRHGERLMTVYGRLGETSVAKGQRVTAGQEIGRVGEPESGTPRLHFEVRRGAFSEDPEPYLEG